MRRLSAFILVLLALATSPVFAQSRLPRDVIPDHYDLTFTVDLANDRFTGLATIRVRVNAPTSRIVLHALDLELEEVTIAPHPHSHPPHKKPPSRSTLRPRPRR